MIIFFFAFIFRTSLPSPRPLDSQTRGINGRQGKGEERGGAGRHVILSIYTRRSSMINFWLQKQYLLHSWMLSQRMAWKRKKNASLNPCATLLSIRKPIQTTRGEEFQWVMRTFKTKLQLNQTESQVNGSVREMADIIVVVVVTWWLCSSENSKRITQKSYQVVHYAQRSDFNHGSCFWFLCRKITFMIEAGGGKNEQRKEDKVDQKLKKK